MENISETANKHSPTKEMRSDVQHAVVLDDDSLNSVALEHGNLNSHWRDLDTENVSEYDIECVANNRNRETKLVPDIQDNLPTAIHIVKDSSIWETVVRAYQTLGVVYGDLGTSPLYVYPTINAKSPNERDLLGILSIIFWTLTLTGVVKYVFLVLRADDHGEGGTFALYSLLCRHANIGEHSEKHYNRLESDKRLSHFSNPKCDAAHSNAILFMEHNAAVRKILLFVAMLGTCMLIGDGILTPAISVLSAVSGIKTAVPSTSQSVIVGLSALILLFLFLLQRFGTRCVSFLFSPIMATWLISTPIVGLYNIVTHYPTIFKALSPHYIIVFFQQNGRNGWLMLGGTVLCITGAEAMFADLGHFDKHSIKVAFSFMVYPSVILTYAGQTAYIIKNPSDASDPFYKFLPSPVYWPMFVVATLAAIVASQGLISAAFSIIKQSMALDYFPRVKIVHTSQDKEGQIYSPEVNYILMILCLAVVFGFHGETQIGNAFGVAVIMVMIITTVLLTFVMLVIWQAHWQLATLFFVVFGSIEGVYFSAVILKLPQGGWLPFAVACFLVIIMFSWSYGRQKKLEHDMAKKMSLENLELLLSSLETQRVPGLCFFYSNVLNGVPPIVRHYVQNVRSLHQIIIFTTIRYIPVKTVLPRERFLVGGLGCQGVYRCIARYGYKDFINAEGEEFVDQVMNCLETYLSSKADEESICDDCTPWNEKLDDGNLLLPFSFQIRALSAARQAGAVHVLGKTDFKIRKETCWFDKIFLGKLYYFLHNNCRSATHALKIPTSTSIEIGMLYEV